MIGMGKEERWCCLHCTATLPPRIGRNVPEGGERGRVMCKPTDDKLDEVNYKSYFKYTIYRVSQNTGNNSNTVSSTILKGVFPVFSCEATL